MATNQDEALDLKRRARRRLIGAIALLLFLVIVPPWIMDLEPKPVETSLQVDIPKPETAPLPAVPETAPATQAPAAQAPEGNAEATSKAPAQSSEAPAASPSAPTGTEKPPVVATAEQAPATRSAKPVESKQGEAYIVPLATLANKNNVKDLQAKVALAGIRSYTEPVKTASGEQTRVRAGPFKTQAEAERARERLSGLGLKPGKVTTR